VFRLAAIAVGLLPLVLFELVCAGMGWGRSDLSEDPFVGFSATHPLFVLSADKSRYEIAPARLTHFRPDSFAAVKQPDEVRIFCLGGSTVQGRPYSIETSFTKFLELSLQAAEPTKRFKVVNCGGVSYATYRLVPILEEVLHYQPDLIVFYEGHNEFLEDRTYADIKHAPHWLSWAYERVASLHTYNLLASVAHSFRDSTSTPNQPATTLGPEVDARLDWRGGLRTYHRDPAWQRDCIEHFEFNIRRAIELARRADVPLLLVNPASNLDWAPFKAEHRAGLSAEDLKRLTQLWDEAREHYRDDKPRSLAVLKEAAAIDPEHAGLEFDLGKCYQALGLMPQARETLIRAKDLDVCPLRILSPMNAIILRVAAETDTMLVDADALFTARSTGEINGAEWFVDHVHPTIEGHELLGARIADELAAHAFVQPVANWKADAQVAYKRHIDSLPPNYFPDGQKRLRSEQGWARGRAIKERPAE
jgi:tetratricopeptide (TPR) repeat protein